MKIPNNVKYTPIGPKIQNNLNNENAKKKSKIQTRKKFQK